MPTRLYSDSECPECFGTGINDDSTACELCKGRTAPFKGPARVRPINRRIMNLDPNQIAGVHDVAKASGTSFDDFETINNVGDPLILRSLSTGSTWSWDPVRRRWFGNA